MENLNPEIKNKIIEFLKTKKIGASSLEISKNIGHNRITISKYLEVLKAHGILIYEGVAQAKLWRLSASSGKTVLVVDDEHHVINLVKLSLLPGNYNVIAAYSGQEALAKIDEKKPDVVILDLMMPKMDGYEVCRRIKDNPLTTGIPILILSAKAQLNDKFKALELGAEDYIVKPFDPMELEAKINIMLRKEEDYNHVTRLPGRSMVERTIHEKITTDEKFTIYSFSIANFDKFVSKFGRKKANDVLILTSRLIKGIPSETSFNAHITDDCFVVMSTNIKLEHSIVKSFEEMLPYIYDDNVPKDFVHLNAKKIGSEEIKKNKYNAAEIMSMLGIK